MTVRAKIRLSLYERGIVDALVAHYGYTAQAARELTVRYIDVVRKIGGYEQSFYYSELIHRAKEADYSPAAWLKRIGEVERGELRDKGVAAVNEG